MALNVPGLVRLPSDEEINAYLTDGAVVLRGVLDAEFVLAMAEPIERLMREPEMADMTAMGDGLEATGETVLRDASQRRGRFISGVDHWLRYASFRDFACSSGVPAIVSTLFGSSKVNLWEDSVLVKEPGTGERTAWHQDLSYFHVAGEQL